MALDMKELRAKDEDALKTELSEMYKAGFSLRMQLATQQMTNSSLIRTTRRDIARIKTVLAEKAAAK